MNASTERERDEAYAKMGFSKEERIALIGLYREEAFKKGHVLVKEGSFFLDCYHVMKGCVRQYFLKDGEEITTQFYTEEDSINPSSSPKKMVPSKYIFECTEDSILSITTVQEEIDLYKRFPRFERLCRISSEEKLIEQHEMFSNWIASSPEERYLNLMQTRPALINRVAQYHLASYLGIKPESLSRIRKRISSKI